jgi:hypothetical protein
MQIIVDLDKLTTDKEVLHKFGEVFELGGPATDQTLGDRSGWGQNWNALNDSLSYLAVGGIWLTSKKFTFPLVVEIQNSEEFQKNNPKGFSILKDVLDTKIEQYKNYGQILEVII